MMRRALVFLMLTGMLGFASAQPANATEGAQRGAQSDAQPGAQPGAQPDARPGAQPKSDAASPDAIAQGRQLFLKTGCYNCHGFEATGGGIAPDLTTSKLTAQQMTQTIHDGRPGTLMPAWGKQLDAGEIAKIVTYLRSARPGA